MYVFYIISIFIVFVVCFWFIMMYNNNINNTIQQ